MLDKWGTIDEMVSLFEQLSGAKPTRLLQEGLEGSDFIRKNMTRIRLLGRGRKVVPTYVSVGLETPDGKYLLATTGAQGPYKGVFTG